jgi:hypothetical protein
MMKPQLQSLYLLALELHRASVELEVKLNAEMSTCVEKTDAVDVAYAMRETWSLVHDVRKRVYVLQQRAEKLAVALNLADGSAENIKTDYCTATPKIRTIVSIPRRSTDPENFGKLMAWLGVPKDLWDKGDEEKEVLRPHWPGLIDHIADRLQEGKPMPPGVEPNKTYAEYSLVMRGKKGIAE